MIRISVGEPLIPGKTDYPEGQFDIINGTPYLLLALKNLTDKELENYKTGKPLFSVVGMGNIIFFLSKFGDLPWMDSPYSVHLSFARDIPLPTPSFLDNTGVGLIMVLLDGDTGIIKALRHIGLETGTSIKLKTLVDAQERQPFDERAYLAQLEAINVRFTTLDLLEESLKD